MIYGELTHTNVNNIKLYSSDGINLSFILPSNTVVSNISPNIKFLIIQHHEDRLLRLEKAIPYGAIIEITLRPDAPKDRIFFNLQKWRIKLGEKVFPYDDKPSFIKSIYLALYKAWEILEYMVIPL